MNRLSGFVSLHPYFKVPPDKMPHLKAILPEFAEALVAHLDNVSAMLAQALTMAELVRIEVHGPAAELDKLKEPLAELNPAWFVSAA
jgi:hypothetical protein